MRLVTIPPPPAQVAARTVPVERITSDYLHRLQWKFHEMERRGIVVNLSKIVAARLQIADQIQKHCDIISKEWGMHIYVGAENALSKGDIRRSCNINTSSGDKSLLKTLQDIGYKVPKITRKNSETGDYETSYSAGELAIQKILQSPEIALKGGDKALLSILEIREAAKLMSSYFKCRFYTSPEDLVLFLTSYNCVGTLSGRRGSKKHVFQYGNNAQNIPKHGKLAKLYRSCLEARPGHILVSVDQISAEEWPVNALANNSSALAELRSGVDRHTKLASELFNIPIDSRTEEQWKKSLERYLGKKTRHARNYGMKGQTMSDSLAKEGKFITKEQCDSILAIAAKLDPSIGEVFHVYVQDCIKKSRILVSPFGRQRQFLGFRPNNANTREFNEAYSYIPQGVVGDNNGFSFNRLEYFSELPLVERYCVQENHDSLVFDVPDSYEKVRRLMEELQWAYDRPITFYNGITINIPIEMEIGYNFASLKSLAHMNESSLREVWDKIHNEPPPA